MDRNVVTATILIGLIMVVWLTWLAPPAPIVEPIPEDSTLVQQPSVDIEEVVPLPAERLLDPAQVASDSTVLGAAEGESRLLTVRTDRYEAVLSTRGGTIRSMELFSYQDAADSSNVQLVDSSLAGALAMVFTTPDSRVYDTRSFFFDADTNRDLIEVGDEAFVLRFRTAVGDGAISKTYTFRNDSYEVGYDLDLENPEAFLTASGYELIWNGAVPFSEVDIENEAIASGAFARSGGEVESAKVLEDSYSENSIRGDVDWVAVKTKYFTNVILPNAPGRGAELIAERFGEMDSEDLALYYQASLSRRFPEGTESFRLYMGPMELSRIRQYGVALYDMVDFGWDFFASITRPLAKYVFVPVFDLLAAWIPNYGLVIIIFSILVKLLVYPLTKKSFTSMAKMRELQPRMEAIKAKFPDNPQKQQEAMMKMYKETGVNPLGGCLPMLLQYPIIIALWQFLPQAIEIRQEGFLWAADLSAPDVILQLPFSIPLYGDFVAGFTVLMGLSMVVQMRLQGNLSANPQTKMLTYIFPVMIFVIFNRLAAGLNLYYLCYNVLSAAQQQVINRSLHNHPEQLEPKKPVKKKGGNAKRRKRR
ncbi:MAG: membrane protein insertase YidC [Rhodothermales bacterium]|nr:membrane protein insertase YidC [Rhodothermales bacterium]MBO6778848.1 membrane protein insertase YidC [Rhodothermales bacterium]